MTFATLTVTRIRDAAAEDIDIEVTVIGTYTPADPDVGIMSDGFVDIYAEDEHGNEVELDDHERHQACEMLRREVYEEAEEACARTAESRADARRYWRDVEHGE